MPDSKTYSVKHDNVVLADNQTDQWKSRDLLCESTQTQPTDAGAKTLQKGGLFHK